MNNRNQTITLCFSVLIALAVLVVCICVDKNLSWRQYAMAGLGTFIASYCVLYLLHLIFGQKDEEQVTTNVNDGDVFYNYNDYSHGYSRVERIEVLNAATQQLRSTFAFADKTGEIVTKWYNVATDFIEPGVAAVAEDVNGELRWNFIDENCELLTVNWFYKIAENYSDNKIKVYWNDGTINFLDLKEKKLLWENWKKSVY